jgi:cobalt-zinc-cadmium efflux system outer membrane protein
MTGLLPGTAAAEEPLSIDDAVQLALAKHPLLAAKREKINAARGMLTQAGVRPNPRLFVQSENWNFGGSPTLPVSAFTDQFLYASQVLETAGKRGRRIDLGESGVRIAELERELLVRQIITRVKQAYWAAAGAQRVLELLRESQENFRQTVAYHEIRVREGAMAELDLLRVRLEGDRVTVAAAAAALEAERTRIGLFREMGEGEFPDTRLTTPLESAGAPPVADVRDAVRRRPEMKIAQEVVGQACANLGLQEAVAKPDVEILSGYKRTAGFNTVLWGIQMNLPFSNRNQGNITAATSEIHAAELALDAVERQVRAEVLTAQRDVESRRRQLTDLLAESIQRAEASVEIARAAYREGGADLLRLLDAERVHIELEVLNARTLAEYQQSLVALETALGVGP